MPKNASSWQNAGTRETPVSRFSAQQGRLQRKQFDTPVLGRNTVYAWRMMAFPDSRWDTRFMMMAEA